MEVFLHRLILNLHQVRLLVSIALQVLPLFKNLPHV